MRKRTIIIVLAAVFAMALFAALLVLYGRTKVATIVNDERAWDLRDASPQKKVIISEVVGNLIYEEGDCPCTYECLEFRDGCFRIRIAHPSFECDLRRAVTRMEEMLV